MLAPRHLRRRAGSFVGARCSDSGSHVYLLDTNVVSELRRARPDRAVLDWIDDVPADQLYLSAVTIGEIQSGIELTRKQDPSKAEELRRGSIECLPPATFCRWMPPRSGFGPN